MNRQAGKDARSFSKTNQWSHLGTAGNLIKFGGAGVRDVDNGALNTPIITSDGGLALSTLTVQATHKINKVYSY